MSFTNEDLDNILKRFEAEIVSENDRNIRQCYQNLKRHILVDGLNEIGCLILLTRALNLMSNFEGDVHTDAYKKLAIHLVVVEDVHKKFFSVIHEINYDILLYNALSKWEILSDSIEIDFSKHEDEFIEARKEDNFYKLLQEFFRIFLSVLEGQLEKNKFQSLKSIIEMSLEGYKFCESWDVFGLFALSGGAKVYGIRVNPIAGSGKVEVINVTDNSISTGANRVVASVRNIIPGSKEYDFRVELEREDIKYSGKSIDLAFCGAIAKKTKGLEIDPYTSFTGCVNSIETGEIGKVNKINEKLEAASNLGIRRVFIPNDNMDDIKGTFPGLEIVPVSTILEVFKTLEDRSFLGRISSKSDLFNAKVKKLIILLKEEKIIYLPSKEKSIPGGVQLWFTNYAYEVPVNLYEKNLKWVPGGSSSPLKKKIEYICSQVFGESGKGQSPEKSSISLKVTDRKIQSQVQDFFSKSDDVTIEKEKNCLYRAKITKNGSEVYVRQFLSGTLRIDGHQDLYAEVLTKIQNIIGISDEVVSEASTPNQKIQTQIETVRSIDLGSQWIGTDESGKGDYYGPLVGAAVLIDLKTGNILEELGIKDSKMISDKRVHELAAEIMQVCGEKAQVIPISPEKYNELYYQFTKEGKNLNTLLAWAHTRGIENIIERYGVEDITVIVDKFADESYIQSKLLEGGRKAKLIIVQLPKAEANIAVAAASVLARSEFLRRLDNLSIKYRLQFPKGASDPKVVDIGKKVIQNFGEDELRKIAKLHFKTTKKII